MIREPESFEPAGEHKEYELESIPESDPREKIRAAVARETLLRNGDPLSLCLKEKK